jgi:cytochrome c oxidase subunit II
MTVCSARSALCRSLFARILAVLGLFMSVSAMAADAAAGKAAFAICAACHGAEGQGNLAMNAPRLAGQEGWYLKRQMDAFRAGLRGTAPGDMHGAQMRPMAISVSAPAALDNLIAYIATLPDTPNATTVTGDAAAGKTAYGVCAACHGADGKGNQALGGPRLVGQDDWYLVRQLKNYRQGLRGYDPKDTYGAQMKPMAATLATDQAVNDVVAYINSLR